MSSTLSSKLWLKEEKTWFFQKKFKRIKMNTKNLNFSFKKNRFDAKWYQNDTKRWIRTIILLPKSLLKKKGQKKKKKWNSNLSFQIFSLLRSVFQTCNTCRLIMEWEKEEKEKEKKGKKKSGKWKKKNITFFFFPPFLFSPSHFSIFFLFKIFVKTKTSRSSCWLKYG